MFYFWHLVCTVWHLLDDFILFHFIRVNFFSCYLEVFLPLLSLSPPSFPCYSQGLGQFHSVFPLQALSPCRNSISLPWGMQFFLSACLTDPSELNISEDDLNKYLSSNHSFSWQTGSMLKHILLFCCFHQSVVWLESKLWLLKLWFASSKAREKYKWIPLYGHLWQYVILNRPKWESVFLQQHFPQTRKIYLIFIQRPILSSHIIHFQTTVSHTSFSAYLASCKAMW